MWSRNYKAAQGGIARLGQGQPKGTGRGHLDLQRGRLRAHAELLHEADGGGGEDVVRVGVDRGRGAAVLLQDLGHGRAWGDAHRAAASATDLDPEVHRVLCTGTRRWWRCGGAGHCWAAGVVCTQLTDIGTGAWCFVSV